MAGEKIRFEIPVEVPEVLLEELERQMHHKPNGTGVDGNCFEMAVHMLILDPEFIVCHGTPIARGGPAEGEPMWHAWVERHEPGRGWMAYDFSNSQRIVMKRAAYYRLGKVKYDEVLRYDRFAVAEMLETHDKLCGPWVDGWETMAH